MKQRKTTSDARKAHTAKTVYEVKGSDFDYGSLLLQDAPARPVKVDIFMRLYIGDYLKDTLHLSTFEHGVYFLLIMAYWTNGGPLPDDNAQLANIARLTLDQWLAVRPRMTDRFFQIRNGQWHHKRIELELLKAKADLETKHERGKKGADARWQKKRAKNAVGDASALPEQSQSESQSQSKVESEADAGRVLPVVPVLADAVEEELMRRTRDVLGDAEMNENGGLWRIRMRENPSAYRSVLEEMESMQKEQHLPARQWQKGPAQCMTDLWKRWKGPFGRRCPKAS